MVNDLKHDIVGQSKDNNQSLIEIQSIGEIGQALQGISKRLLNHENRMASLEDTMRVNGIQEMKITDAVNKKVVRWLGGKDAPAYKDKSTRGKTYSNINKDLKRKYGVPRRSEIPAKDYDAAMSYIENWEPDQEVKLDILQINNRLKLFEHS